MVFILNEVKMKRIILFFTILFITVCGTSCTSAEDNSNNNSSENSLTIVSTFVCGYDYGLHVENKAVMLLSGSGLFFKPDEYGIDYPLIAGDEIKVTHEGEIWIQETYPSTVITKEATILKIEVVKATLEEFEIVLDDGKKQIGKWYLQDSLGIIDLNGNRPYVVNQDGSFCFFDELEVGQKIYASTPSYQEGLSVSAYYSYLPR